MNRFLTIIASMGVVVFLFLGFAWGERLLSQEWITRVDYLLLFFSGLGVSFCLSVLIFMDINN